MAGKQQKSGKCEQPEEWHSQAPVHFHDYAETRFQQKVKLIRKSGSYQGKTEKRHLAKDSRSCPGNRWFVYEHEVKIARMTGPQSNATHKLVGTSEVHSAHLAS